MDAPDYSAEVWKDVPGWEGYYEVSSLGRVKGVNITHNYHKPRILKASPDKDGYPRVAMCKNGTVKYATVHCLMAQSFMEPDPERPYVNHKDGIKTNCVLDNLEWCTIKENNQHARDTGLVDRRGDKSNFATFSEKEVTQVRRLISDGLSNKRISEMMGTTPFNIWSIRNGRTWKHFP